jgi:aminoglycoside phosphotransferase (APT) family kinase protein
MFELTVENAAGWAAARGLVPDSASVTAEELTGGVSSTVIALRGPGVAVVVKQALPRLRVQDVWIAKTERSNTEAAAMSLCGGLTPAAVPRVLAHDPGQHCFAMELVRPEARNWQAEISEGRAHVDAGAWAGTTLGTWHAATARRADVAAAFNDFEAFEQLRLRPYHETVIARRPQLAGAIVPRLAELRTQQRCLVHGDYAAKNMLVVAGRGWVLDFEVAHTGHPVFDLGFFLSFLVLSAVRWPSLTNELRSVASLFLDAYATAAGDAFTGDEHSITAHTACLVLSRTDGMSPAQFLDDPSREHARAAAIAMLERPERGLWSWS